MKQRAFAKPNEETTQAAGRPHSPLVTAFVLAAAAVISLGGLWWWRTIRAATGRPVRRT
jgi:hypothetical protein